MFQKSTVTEKIHTVKHVLLKAQNVEDLCYRDFSLQFWLDLTYSPG